MIGEKSAYGDELADPMADHKEAQTRFREAIDFDKDNRDRAYEDLKMRAGEQWAAADLAERQRDRRVTLTFNRYPQFIKQITGELRRNKPSIHCFPGDGSADVKTAHIYEGLIRSIERLSLAPKVYARAAEHAATCGMGHFRLELEYTEDEGFDLEPRIKPIRNPFSVVWDPSAVTDDKSDARHCFVYTEMDAATFKKRFPDAGLASAGVSKPMSIQQDPLRKGPAVYTVAEYWCVKDEPTTLVEMIQDRPWMDEFGNMQEPSGNTSMLHDPDEQILAEAASMGFRPGRSRPSKRRKIVVRLMNDQGWLTEEVEWPGHRIPIFTVVGEEVDVGDVVIRHGLIRYAHDAQRVLNLTRSNELEYIAQTPKVPYLTAVESIKGFENDWVGANRTPKSHLRYRAYDDQKNQLPIPRRQDPLPSNPALLNLSSAVIDEMKAVIGIYDASLGSRSNETSGVAIQARDAQADTGTYVYIDNLSTQIEACGREIATLIPILYSPRKMIRILGPDDAPAIIQLDQEGVDLSRGKYDVIVKTGPAFESRRQEARNQIVEVLRTAPPPFVPALISRLARLGEWDDAEDLADELDAIAIQAGLKPPPPGAMPPPGMMPPGMAPPMQPGAPPQPFAPVSPSGSPAPGQRVAPPMMAGRAGMMGA